MYFNSRPSARGDGTSIGAEKRWIYFNSRPSARGDPSQWRPSSPAAFQFTPLREGRLDEGRTRERRKISIHAPPRGATLYTRAVCLCLDISIHAPPRGATVEIAKECAEYEFQFTPLREGRLTNFLHRNMMKLFQFTPLREGRQFEKSPGKGYQLLFQFTPLREGRPLPLWKLYPFREFQFTPLREGRLLPLSLIHI